MHQSDNATYLRPASTAKVEYDQKSPDDGRRDGLHVGMVGTYPPTECGIATFSANVREALMGARPGWRVSVVSVVDEVPEQPAPEATYWARSQTNSLQASIEMLNNCDTVIIQHEFGIFPGRDGESVLDLVDSLRVPLVVSLHTVLTSPSPHQHVIVQRLIDAADVVVVPSASALERLRSTHATRDVTVVPHGASANFTDERHLASAPTILTWGLLGPGKGLEQGIEAVSLLGDLEPAARYVLSGRTHPNLRRAGEDPYRRSLEKMVSFHGVNDVVHFDDRYQGWGTLRAMIRRASVVLLPYQSRDQISSGVLVEALASGKPIVATPFPHAIEMLSSGAGLLVDFDDVEAMAGALRKILVRPELAQFMSEQARSVGHTLLWPQIGRRLGAVVEELTERVAR